MMEVVPSTPGGVSVGGSSRCTASDGRGERSSGGGGGGCFLITFGIDDSLNLAQ